MLNVKMQVKYFSGSFQNPIKEHLKCNLSKTIHNKTIYLVCLENLLDRAVPLIMSNCQKLDTPRLFIMMIVLLCVINVNIIEIY